MGIYKLTIATGGDIAAGTCDDVSVVLVGLHGESAKHKLQHNWSYFRPGSVTDFDINEERDLGDLLLIRLSTEQYKTFNMDAWYCDYIKVTCPNGQQYKFPFYQWIPIFMTVEVPEGKGVILSENTNPLLQQQRQKELAMKRATHPWHVYAEGAPHCIDIKDGEPQNLPPNDQYSFLKLSHFTFTAKSTQIETKLKGLQNNTNSWDDIEDVKLVFCLRKSENSETVSKMWKEDAFFGDQYLNGINPVMIKKCFKLPENFPVGEEMVAPSLGTSTSLHKELENGNIFLADYKILEGVPANSSINAKQQYMAAPMCLLWKNHHDKIVPIAIQLSQKPGEDAPIFLPSDSEYDWLLAKIWVRNAEFQVHEVDTHLLRTHLFAEVFNIATTRQLPMSHPIYKLLIPHLRYTLQINALARKTLIGPNGLFDQAVASGRGGIPVLIQKAMKDVTYSSLCLPDHIESRGMESIPNYFYRDDGMKIWQAIESFVSQIVNYYYTCDGMVSKDPELQAWVAEIFKEGFLEYTASGMPSSLETKASLTKYLTMVIFTCSAQHAAVNTAQFDIYAWMPNGPTSMKSPPPTAKGVTTMQKIFEALPDVNTTTTGLSTVWLLSNEPGEPRRLGQYPDVHFTESTPQKFIADFQAKLDEISKSIKARNVTMQLKYYYLDPCNIENSVSI
ncbi:hydroperoxide isomerase ALOXE3-like [Gastrophryne carolinensis]